jgi:hypothetical protein
MTAWPPNPYDFSTPAPDRSFAGRAKEIGLVKRFASGIGEDSQAHLLIHGRRGVGKSSLLGQARKHLARRGLISAEVTLDDGSAQETAFLIECFLGLANAVIDKGGFGGRGGEYEGALQNALLGREVDRGIGPVGIAEFVAVAHASAGQVRIPDGIVAADISALVDEGREVGSPTLVLVIDEADRLAAQVETVQRFRNLFVMPGLISTILAGTDEILSALDTAFAPTSRHFHKLELRPLADARETQMCVLKPLLTPDLVGRIHIAEAALREIHSLTRGSPYEIALLCHVMYDQLVLSGGNVLSLSDAVLDQVADQLRPAPADAAALTILRQAGPETIRLAARYCVDPHLSLHDHALIQCAFNNPTPELLNTTEVGVLGDWGDLVDRQLATTDGRSLTPTFGELGRLYLKYRARKAGLLPAQVEGSFADRLADRLTDEIGEIASEKEIGLDALYPRSRLVLSDGVDPETYEDMELIRGGDLEAVAQRNRFLANLPQQEHIATEGADAEFLMSVPFEVGEDGFEAVLHFRGRLSQAQSDDLSASIAALFESAAPYRVKLGRINHVVVSALDWSLLWAIRDVASGLQNFVDGWGLGDRKAAADFAAELLERHRARFEEVGSWPEVGLQLLNDLGFMELAAGHLVQADEFLQQCATRGGISETREALQRLIVLCNLGVVAAGQGRFVEARDWFGKVDAHQQNAAIEHAGWLVVYTPDPDWPLAPKLVTEPEISAVVRMSEASVLARLGQAEALDMARTVAEGIPDRWVFEVLESIAQALGDESAASAARKMRLSAPESEADEVDPDAA